MYSYLIRGRDEEYKDMLEKMKKGQGHSEEARKKISESMKGIRRSDATRERMAFSATVRWAKERNRRKKLKAIMEIGSYSEVEASPAKTATEQYDTDGSPTGEFYPGFR